MKARYSRNGGFGLIEVLIALVILGVGLMGLARLQLSMLAGTADTAAYDHAIRLANDGFESLRFARFAGSLPTAGSDERTVQGMVFQRSWTIACSVEQACHAAVTLRWQEPRAGTGNPQREITLEGYLSPGMLAAQAWLVQSGPPTRETLP